VSTSSQGEFLEAIATARNKYCRAGGFQAKFPNQQGPSQKPQCNVLIGSTCSNSNA